MDGGKTTPFVRVLLFILGTESIVSFLGNGFIVVVIGQKWLQSRKMLPFDLLLTALGTTRFLFQVILVIYLWLFIYPLDFFCHGYLWKSFFCAWIYFNSASIWCATWLSVFYCVKITNFTHCLFLWLKLKIDILVPRLLGLSLTVFSLPPIASTWEMSSECSSAGNISGNTSQHEDRYNRRVGIFGSLQFIFIAINVSICLSCSILLLTSLWRHIRNLKRSSFASKDCNTQAHINAINTLLSFLFFYFLYVAVLTTSLAYSLNTIEGLVANVVQDVCPSAHSIVLILTNPKLKEMFVRLLRIRQRTS